MIYKLTRPCTQVVNPFTSLPEFIRLAPSGEFPPQRAFHTAPVNGNQVSGLARSRMLKALHLWRMADARHGRHWARHGEPLRRLHLDADTCVRCVTGIATDIAVILLRQLLSDVQLQLKMATAFSAPWRQSPLSIGIGQRCSAERVSVL